MKQLQWVDYVVVMASLTVTAVIGLYYGYKGRKKTTVFNYLLGDRNMNSIAVAISLTVTFFTAVMYTGVPVESYLLGIGMAWYSFGLLTAVVITAYVFLPALYPLKLTTTYEYLHKRFDSKSVRIIGASIGLLTALLYNSLTTYAAAAAIASVSDIPVLASISVITALATVYTSLGGLKAVIWTDVFQFTIMLAGVMSVLIVGTVKVGGVENVIRMATLGGRINNPTWNPDPRIYYSMWSMLIGSSTTSLTIIAVQQVTVQRFNSISNISSARRSILLAVPGFVFFAVTACLMGLIIYSYYHSIACDPLANGEIRSINQIVPYFVSNVLSEIPGLAGIFIAALCCSTLSTVSSMLNSVSAMVWEDMLRFCFGKLSERRITVLLKIIVFVFGAVLILFSLAISKLQSTILRVAIAMIGSTTGPVVGLFILGLTVPQANWIGAVTGVIVSLTICSFVAVVDVILPSAQTLPLGPISGCASSNFSTAVNMTSALMTLAFGNLTFSDIKGTNYTNTNIQNRTDVTGYLSLFRLSPTYISLVGMLFTFLVGLPVSLLTGPTNPSAVAPELLFSAPRRFFSRWGNSPEKETEKNGERDVMLMEEIQGKETCL